jgi:SAM-dependent methyltransferase
VLWVALCVAPAWAEVAAQGIDGEFSKQEKIYRSRGAEVPAGYVTERGLRSYQGLLPSGFLDALAKLGPGDRWLDIGTGGGRAILDYYTLDTPAPGAGLGVPLGKARAVGISIEDRRTEQWRQKAATFESGRITYLHGKRLREYSAEELGKFSIITDVYGGFSYTDNLSVFMEIVMGALNTGGSFYTLMQSVHLQNGKDSPETWYLTELQDRSGRPVKLCTWLRSLSCAKVTCESKAEWDAPTELIHVQKTCDPVSVPSTRLLTYEAGNPPGRRFLVQP